MKVLSELAVACAVIAASCGSPQNPKRAPLTAKEIVNVSKPAIVRIEVGEDRFGTGFVIDKTGLVATNLHVVLGADDIQVRLLDGSKYKVMRVVGWDENNDLAILDIDPPGDIPVLALGDSDTAEQGDPVLAIGNPLGVLDYTVSDGLLSAMRVVTHESTLFQITAPISQGSSGGPVFNSYGEVIAVVTAYLPDGQSLNFAIPSNYLAKLGATKKPPSTPSEFRAETAKFVRGARGDEPDDNAPIVRSVPRHDLKILDECTREALVDVEEAIKRAIQLGAPLYNGGHYEACFMIYESVAIKYALRSSCRGVRTALDDGLKRAATLSSAKAKAWALRDAFDGLIDERADGVIVRKLRTLP